MPEVTHSNAMARHTRWHRPFPVSRPVWTNTAGRRLLILLSALALVGCATPSPAATGAPARIVASIPVPNNGALGPADDGVWVMDRGNVQGPGQGDANTASMSRIDPATNEVTDTVAGVIGAELVQSGGQVWVASAFYDRVLRVDPKTGEIEQIRHERLTTENIAQQTTDGGLDTADVYPYAIAATNDAVWVANHHAGSLTRLDPATADVLRSIQVIEPGGSGPNSVSANGDRVWVGSARSFDIVEIDTTTNAIVDTTSIEPFGACGAMTADATAVWVTSGFDAPDADPCKQEEHWGVSRIDRESHEVTHIDVGGRPFGVALLDGAAWVVTDIPTPELVRIDIATNEVTGRMPLPLPPFLKMPIVAAHGSLWIRIAGATAEDGAVLRVEPLD